MRTILGMALCITLILLAGCAAPGAQTTPPPIATLETPSSTLTPATPQPTISPQQRIERLTQAFHAAFSWDTTGYAVDETETYGDIIARLELWRTLEDDLRQAIQYAVAAACAQTGEQMARCDVALDDWRLVATIFHRFGERAPDVLMQGCEFTFHMDALDSAVGAGVSTMAAYKDLRAMLATESGEAAFGPKLTYAYLNTVYDADGEEIPFTQYALEEAYIRALQDPLPGKHIKDGWYNDRDRGERKHTGTDIRAAEDTPILSCTDGTVIHISTNAGAGNYVVVLDDYGVEYHYYHMVRLTALLQIGERVHKGDVVGHVGNTGNSAANHLHLTMISPIYTYINPYPILRDMRALQRE